MLDIKFIRDNVDLVQRSANDKGYRVDIAALLQLDDERRDLQNKLRHCVSDVMLFRHR